MLGELLSVCRRIFELRPNFLKHSQNSHLNYKYLALIHSTCVLHCNLLPTNTFIRIQKKSYLHFYWNLEKNPPTLLLIFKKISHLHYYSDLHFYSFSRIVTPTLLFGPTLVFGTLEYEIILQWHFALDDLVACKYLVESKKISFWSASFKRVKVSFYHWNIISHFCSSKLKTQLNSIIFEWSDLGGFWLDFND
jgi:hypothetical protein